MGKRMKIDDDGWMRQGRYHHVDERLVGNDCIVLVGTVCGRLSVAIGGGWAKDENDMTMNSKRMNIMQ